MNRTRLGVEQLAARDCPALFNPAVYSPDFVPFPGLDPAIPIHETFGNVLGDGRFESLYLAGEGGSYHLKVRGEVSPGQWGWLYSAIVGDENWRGPRDIATVEVPGLPHAAIVATFGAGAGPRVDVFTLDGRFSRSFFAYDPDTRFGIGYLDVIEVDGRQQIVTMPGTGGANLVKVIDPATGETARAAILGDPDDRSGTVRPIGAGFGYRGDEFGVYVGTDEPGSPVWFEGLIPVGIARV